jgi:RNA recognition motif-containing protein
MAKNLFVGSLPYSTTDETLSALFSQHGQVISVNIIKDKYSGQSRGFGFVEMGTEEEAQKAISALNGHNLEGRSIVVKEAMPKPDYSQNRDNFRKQGGKNFSDRRNKRY